MKNEILECLCDRIVMKVHLIKKNMNILREINLLAFDFLLIQDYSNTKENDIHSR